MRSPISDSDLHAIAEQAGICLDSQWFPQLSKCPLCLKHNLNLYKDTLYGGLWTHCNYCQFSGDLLEILSQVWEMEYLQVLRHLSKVTYIPSYLINLETCQRFAAIAKKQKKIKEFLQESDAVTTYTPSQDVMHKLGVASFEEFPNDFKKQFRALRFGDRLPDDDSVIVQRGRNCVATLPLYDLPGRVIGWCSFTDDEKPLTKYTYLPEFREAAGICFPNNYSDSFGEFDNHTLVTASVKTALSMQYAAIRRRNRLLPVVGMGELKSRSNIELWLAWPTRNLVFLAKKYPEFAIREARYANGKVFFRESKPQDKWSLEVDQFGKMLEKAIPWEQAVEKLILDTDVGKLNSMLQTLNFDEEFWETHLPNFSTRARLKIDNNVRQLGKTAFVKNKTLYWRESRWMDSKGNTICNAPFKLDRVYDDRGTIKASGKITYEGQEFPFSENLDTIEKNTEKWLKQHMIRNRIGLPLVAPDWRKQLLAISQKFHTPVVDGGSPRVGWDDKFKEFRFPNVCISMDGVEPPVASFSDSSPGKTLLPHTGISEFELKLIGAKSWSKYAYLNLLAMLSTILVARATYGKVEAFVVNQDKEENLALNFAKALDLNIFTLSGKNAADQIKEIEELANASDLPVFVDCRNGDNARVRAAFQQLVDNPIPGVVILASRTPARIASTMGWVMLDIPQSHKASDSFIDALPKLLTLYLEDLCIRKFLFQTTEATKLETVTLDLATWFTKLTGTSKVRESILNYSRQNIDTAGKSQIFWKILAELLESNNINNSSMDKLCQICTDSVLLNFSNFQEICYKEFGLKFDIDVIKNSLEDCNYLLGCDENEIWELPLMILNSYREEYRKFGAAG